MYSIIKFCRNRNWYIFLNFSEEVQHLLCDFHKLLVVVQEEQPTIYLNIIKRINFKDTGIDTQWCFWF